jgi:hypothetical protein
MEINDLNKFKKQVFYFQKVVKEKKKKYEKKCKELVTKEQVSKLKFILSCQSTFTLIIIAL